MGLNLTVTASQQKNLSAPIEVVEIVSNDATVWQSKPGEWDVELNDVPIPAPQGKDAYCYLRMRQVDGHIAWLSPVWLDCLI